jgi:hypothetical protein
MSIKRLEAVIVCKDYSDFLAETLPWNIRQFDRIVVVTSPDDVETQQLCAHLSVECRTTNLFDHEKDDEAAMCDTIGVKKDHRPGRNNFCKSRGIDLGLAYLNRDDWIVHLDADIWLPPMFRNWFTWMQPEKDCIYGMDRFNCIGYEPWQDFLSKNPRDASFHQHIRHCLVIPPPFQPGARISIKEYGGYVPIGFFQAWHGSTNRRYPHSHGSAEHTDVLHSLQWPKNKRRKMAEAYCVHLESKNSGPMGRNWNGRTSEQFGPYDPFGIRKPGAMAPRQRQAETCNQSGPGRAFAVQPPSPSQPNQSSQRPIVNVSCTCNCTPCCCCGYGYGYGGFGQTPCPPEIVVIEE